MILSRDASCSKCAAPVVPGKGWPWTPEVRCSELLPDGE